MPKLPKKIPVVPKSAFPSHHPRAIEDEADAMPSKTKVHLFEVEAYSGAIIKLIDRGYSYEETTTWLNEKLAAKLGEKKIKRGQVYRIYQQTKEFNDPRKETLSATHIDDADAEAEAELSDKKSKKEKETAKET